MAGSPCNCLVAPNCRLWSMRPDSLAPRGLRSAAIKRATQLQPVHAQASTKTQPAPTHTPWQLLLQLVLTPRGLPDLQTRELATLYSIMYV